MYLGEDARDAYRMTLCTRIIHPKGQQCQSWGVLQSTLVAGCLSEFLGIMYLFKCTFSIVLFLSTKNNLLWNFIKHKRTFEIFTVRRASGKQSGDDQVSSEWCMLFDPLSNKRDQINHCLARTSLKTGQETFSIKPKTQDNWCLGTNGKILMKPPQFNSFYINKFMQNIQC